MGLFFPETIRKAQKDSGLCIRAQPPLFIYTFVFAQTQQLFSQQFVLKQEKTALGYKT